MEWRVIEGFSNYSVSDTGLIRNNITSKILKGSTAGQGYQSVILCRNGEHIRQYIHRIVAKAFIPNGMCKPEVNHIDGNKKNNAVNNLEWVTRDENIVHLYKILDSTQMRKKMGLSRTGEQNSASHKVIRLEDGKIYSCVSDAAKDIGVHRMCVSDVCRGIQKTSKGYHFSYLDKIGEGMVDSAHSSEEHKDE